ncbi:MTH865 family protein [Natronoglomus mannanivorans]|uniref:MTH865-like family protein n=1 Tax=Natronoglomus mannanivorans TaxID=2979990 RepID=A0AAP2YXH8_9EURY|nr:hypothetical protein [Halobacteria archaeon AArc-xg1-1]
MTDERRPLREQLSAALEDLTYPVRNETDLTPNFPSWSNTRFESADVSLTPRELLLLVPKDYPYESADELLEAVEGVLREEGDID